MLDIFQHVVVTLAALAAAWIVLRGEFTAVAPGAGAPQCASCPVAQRKSAAPAAAARTETPATTHPMILVRHQQRER